MKPAICLLALCALLAGGATAAAPVPAFDHVVVIVFENKESSSILGNRAAPNFNAYGRRYAKLTRYYGVTHPSLPNYLALVSGSTHGITSDCTDCVVETLLIVRIRWPLKETLTSGMVPPTDSRSFTP